MAGSWPRLESIDAHEQGPASMTRCRPLIRSADLAMYFAKRQCPGTISFFDAAMNTDALKRLTIESKLRSAIAGDEFSLHFQPQFDLGTGKVSGMEALLRWNNAELGSVPPLE